MPKPTTPTRDIPASRAEKLSILSAMLGPEALARVRAVHPDISPQPASGAGEIDADRAAWHRNKLLERLRQQTNPKHSQTPPTQAARHENKNVGSVVDDVMKRASNGMRAGYASLDARLAKISDANALVHEHPAIIARLMKTLSRDERVEALKSLPGPVARSIVRRLR